MDKRLENLIKRIDILVEQYDLKVSFRLEKRDGTVMTYHSNGKDLPSQTQLFSSVSPSEWTIKRTSRKGERPDKKPWRGIFASMRSSIDIPPPPKLNR